MIATTKARQVCRHCGSHNIFPDDEGKPYCGSCGRRQLTRADYGRIGGLQTLVKYGREHFVALGKRGGRPKLRQLSAPEVQLEKKEERLPNNLRVLRELWRAKVKVGEVD